MAQQHSRFDSARYKALCREYPTIGENAEDLMFLADTGSIERAAMPAYEPNELVDGRDFDPSYEDAR
jgi:hypothetical protein